MKKIRAKKPRSDKAVEGVETVHTAGDDDRSDAVDTAERESAEAKAKTKVESSAETTEEVDPVEALQAKVEKLEDSLLRAKADYHNAQRRLAIERADAIRYANAEVMKSLLGVLDDFDRSLAAAENSDDLAPVIDGVRLVYSNLTKALRDHGLEGIDALHEPFDPSVHEAIMQQPSTDFPTGTVVQEVAKGYRLRDRVLRPTKVVVSRQPEDDQKDGAHTDAVTQSEGKSKEERGLSNEE